MRKKGTLFGQGDLHKALSDNQERTISKICEYQKRLKDIIALAQENGADILGGYKGQLLSMISSELSEGAIYLDGIKDKDSSGTENGTLDTENISGYLPHGLVTIKITG